MRRLALWWLPLMLLTGCEKYALDRQMAELCKRDGGVKVHQEIYLSPIEFYNLNMLFNDRNRPRQGQASRFGPYEYMEYWVAIKPGNPAKGEGRLEKYIEKIFRRSDGELLGVSTQYGRAGGDLIVLGHWSTAGCPLAMQPLFSSIFIRRSER